VTEPDTQLSTPAPAAAELPWTAVLLDRQPLWLNALELVLERHGIVTLASTTSTDGARQDVEMLDPTTLVLDPWLDDEQMSGLELVRVLRSQDPGLKIVCLGAIDGRSQIDAAFAAGADAYVLKVAEPDDVAEAIKHVCSELMYFAAPSSHQRLAAAAAAAPPVEDAAIVAVDLTRREREILQIVAEGRSNGEVARLLWVTEQTVKFHLSNIYRKLGVSNRTEAGRWAHLHGLVALRDDRDDLADVLRLQTRAAV
jgi:DNA-binding NarL/FixJ family response regulator